MQFRQKPTRAYGAELHDLHELHRILHGCVWGCVRSAALKKETATAVQQRWSMMMWSLLRLNHLQQTRYTDFVQTKYPTIEVYFPRYEVKARPSGSRHPLPVVRPVFPGYIFANPNFDEGEQYRLIRDTPVKARFVKFGSDIELIPTYVIDELKKLERNRFFHVTDEEGPRYKPGQRVLVHHVLADIQGIIGRVLQNKIFVDTHIGQLNVPIHSVSLINS